MSWCESMCECGEMVSYGFYSSEHEDELTEINITVLCGQCVREREGIPSEDETDARYEDFKNRVIKNGMKESLDFHNIQEAYHKVLLINAEWFDEYQDEVYIRTAFSLLKVMDPTAIYR